MLIFRLAITSFLFFFIISQNVYAATPPPFPCNPNQLGDCPAGLDDLENLFRGVISIVVSIGFIAMLVMLVTAGISYLTSGGEPKAVQQAHFTITWALLGILFMAIAWLILQLIKTFTGIDVTVFDIKALCDFTVNDKNICIR